MTGNRSIGDMDKVLGTSSMTYHARECHAGQHGGCLPSPHPSGSSDCRKVMTYIFRSYLPVHPVRGYSSPYDGKRRIWKALRQSSLGLSNIKVQMTIFGPVPDIMDPCPDFWPTLIACAKFSESTSPGRPRTPRCENGCGHAGRAR